MITLPQIQSLLSNNDPLFIENLAQEAKRIKEQFFGRTISLYAPIYLSNFCSSYCTYCGFHSHNRIKRFKLTADQMDQEMQFVAGQGIENILLLTGESYNVTPISFLKEAVEVAKNYFPSISLEVHPMETKEYQELFEAGVDGITVYQETYDRKRYSEVHISGTKANYDFRYGTPERAAQGEIRSISLGILLGLAENLAADLLALYEHLRFMEKNYPGVEYSVSFPRLRSIKGEDFDRCAATPNGQMSDGRSPQRAHGASRGVNDITFVKIICLTRTLFPRVGINLSTREEARLRDHILELGITRMSAGSNTSVGGYTLIDEESQDPQFDVSDHRSVSDVVKMLKAKNFDPVFTDWRRI